MLSREADAMFWMGRYIERAEATARIIDVQYHSELEGAFPQETLRTGAAALWGPILAIFSDVNRFAERFGNDQSERNVLHFFACDPTNPNSILACVTRARDNAREVREMISSEMYETLNMFYLDVTKWTADRILDTSPHSYFSQVKSSSLLFQGVADRTLPNDEPRRFLECGTFLERAEKTARILDVKYHILLETNVDASFPLDQHQWTAVLKSVGSYEAFRKAHRFGITPAKVVSFLVLNPDFPSSICYSVKAAERALRRINSTNSTIPTNRAERLIGRLLADVSFLTTEEILEEGLHTFLDTVQIRCNEIGNAISEAYLRY